MPSFQLPLAAAAEIRDLAELCFRGNAEPSPSALQLPGPVLPRLSQQLPAEHFCLSHPLPLLAQLTSSISLFFFFSPFNGRKASPPNLIPAPLSQADVTSTSVRLLERPAPAPSRCCRRGSSEGEKKQSADPSAGGRLNATTRPAGGKERKISQFRL